MNSWLFRKALPIAILVLTIALMTGCGSLSGKYEGPKGVVSVEFKGGKAYITNILATVEADYEVSGDRIVLKTPAGNIILVRDNDGTLDGPFGTLTRSRS